MKIGDYVKSKRSFGAISGFIEDFFKDEVLIKSANGKETKWYPIEQFYVDNSYKQIYDNWWDLCMENENIDQNLCPEPEFQGKEEITDLFFDQLVFLSHNIDDLKPKNFKNHEDYVETVVKLSEQMNKTVNSLFLAQKL